MVIIKRGVFNISLMNSWNEKIGEKFVRDLVYEDNCYNGKERYLTKEGREVFLVEGSFVCYV